MSLTGITAVLADDHALTQFVQSPSMYGSADIVAPPGTRAPTIATLSDHIAPDAVVLVVTATGRESDELCHALREYLPPSSVAMLPAWETLPHERLSPRADTVARRLAVFRRIAHPEANGHASPIRVLVAPVRAVLQPVVEGLGELVPVEAHVGDSISLDTIVEQLVGSAYTRTDMVERRGQFAVRGGLLDVFPPTEAHPLRIEFWGDTVEEIRWFAVADQRSLEAAEDGLWAPPCRELLLTDEVRERAEALIPELPHATDMLTKISAGIAVEGMESLTPALVNTMQPVLDMLPGGSVVVLSDPERIRTRAHDLNATTEEFLQAAWTGAAAGAAVPLDLSAASFLSLKQVRERADEREFRWWLLSPFGADTDLIEEEDVAAPSATTVVIDAHDVENYRGHVEKVLADLADLTSQSWRIVLTTEGAGTATRWVEQLRQAGVPARLESSVEVVPEAGTVHVTTATVQAGFVAPKLKFMLCTESELTGRAPVATRDMQRMPSRRRNVVDPLQLRSGDFVVHEQHGVGRFVEMVQRTVGTGAARATREYLVIEYAPSKRGQPGDKLFVPSDSLDQVTKYSGGESPSLNKMGGSDWSRTKSRARKHVRQIASELIRLYSARQATQGFAFSADTPWQRELEDAFPYIETPDQLATIDEVKADMEKSVPMDRLVCGDVGYGKTEIAVRAAFKSVQDGKQVAVLVPTTLLVQQHMETFAERYSGFPVTVKALSRFQTDAEAREVLEGLAKGTIDVVIGTHRLLTGEVRFKDLGLVVVDEEQRFGVEHKETLKQLRTNVDVLAMSATPIPRTLEMAVTGIREMSTLATPPEERHPVLTYVGAYEPKQIGAAIRRELLREGQVFYVHNRVESIDRAAARLREMVPEARIATAHGRMGEGQLEQVIVDFWEKRFDVLVCTTIIETGLDISNANTLILERADLFGLSQLHQLRGRVGRGRERAYAYFLYPPERPLTDTAHDRLATIAANTDLGAGMAVAMKDLEIRGAGNLLGGEQSGHIAGVGFDLYVRMVGEAVAAFKGESASETPEMTIELPVDAHLPLDYIDGERLRLEVYKKLSEAETVDSIEQVREELVDRYGEPPEPVQNLLAVARLRVKAREEGLTDVAVQGKYVRFGPVELRESAQLRLKRVYPGTILKPAVRSILVPVPTTARVGGQPLRDVAILDWAAELIDGVIGGSVAAAANAASEEP